MNNYQKQGWGGFIGSAVQSISNFLSKGWETITGPIKARCDIYVNQAEQAQVEMRKENISRKERKFWAKQNDKAQNGLAEVHALNSDTFVKAIAAVGAGLLIGFKLLGNKEK